MSQIVSVLSKTPNLIQELQKVLPMIRFHEVKNPEVDEELKKSRIIIGDYPLIGPFIYQLPEAEWIQGTWAGVDSLLKTLSAEEPKVLVTRFTGRHFGTLMGEYVVANIINNERNMFKIRNNQLKNIWSLEGKISSYKCIHDLNIGIMGLGHIGKDVAKILHSFGANILAYGRRVSIELNSNVSNYYSGEKLSEFLQQCDYVVNLLPDTTETRGLLNGDKLKNCKEKGATFMNIGRGSIISEKVLIDVLEKKWISAAIFDVCDSEPLSIDSKLWSMQNVFITPHVSGVTRAKDLAEYFKENLELFNAQKPLPGTIDFSKGY